MSRGEEGSSSLSRSSRIVSAVRTGYATQILTVATGLWLTPFLLHRLGADRYGLWLLALQTTAYLGLLDLGVVAVLPRELAYAIGRASGNRESPELPILIGRSLRIVLYQLPLVAVACVTVLTLLPDSWLPVRGPLAMIVACFLVMFPLRTFHGALQGLQETPFLAQVALWMWAAGTLTTVVLVVAGVGLYAVAAGWTVTQIGSAIAWWIRLRSAHPSVLPVRLAPVSRALLRHWMESGIWVSIAQVAQMLLAGTDIYILGHLLGPAAIVPYAITGKLATVLSNQPQMVMQAAQPAISELRTTEGAATKLVNVTTSLGQLMLLISGAVLLMILVVNEGFVRWWTGPAQFAGHAVTFGVLATMLLRHWNTTTVYTMFSMGYERRIALVALADGLVVIMASVLCVRAFGVVGASIGGLAGVALVSLPLNVHTLSRDTGRSVTAVLAPYASWAVRLTLLTLGASIVMSYWVPSSFVTLAITTVLTCLLYAFVMAPVASRDPLGMFLRPRVGRYLRYLRWTSRANVHP